MGNRQGALRVNSTDYDTIEIERLDYWGFGSGLSWAVPAWEEEGEPQLAGPFVNALDAESTLSATV